LGKRTALATLTVAIFAFSGFPTGAATCWTSSTSEKKFAKLTNAAREAAGLVKLKLDPELSKVARKHTKEMIDAGDLFHTPDDVLGKRVTRWVKLGENVGRGPTVDLLQEAFMESVTHKENILKPGYRFIGVGTKVVDESMWVTVIFEARKNPGTTLNMPSC
jgi:uncharacterized protein YkwD